MHKTISKLKTFITKNFGKKCKDYNPFCANCILWHAFDTIKEGFDFHENKPRKKRKAKKRLQ